METLVLDVSATLGFLLKDEQDGMSLSVLSAIRQDTAVFVPVHWPVEVANALLMAERRRRLSQAETREILHLVQTLPITVDEETAERMADDTFALARQYGLTIYDAAYLELAMRRGAKLATSDRDLVKAAKASGVAVFAG
jgi:predicted nucleic acid-binding protein